MIRERLEQGRELPRCLCHNRIAQVRDSLVVELIDHLNTEYRWLASCTVAVQAGYWGGERRRKRRLKLAAMINRCSEILGEPSPLARFPKGWEMTGLYYGYGAWEQVRSQGGLTTDQLSDLMMLQIITDNGIPTVVKIPPAVGSES